MTSVPRFLPVVAIAIGGVLAMKVISGVIGAPDILKFATAHAEGGAKAPKNAKKAKSASEKGEGASSVISSVESSAQSASSSSEVAAKALSVLGESQPAAAETKPAPVCATSAEDLARQANMPVSEINVLSALKQRREQLDAREAQINSQSQLVDAASAKLDNRIKQLADLKSQIEALLAKANKTSDDDNQRLVAVYGAMKPKDAAAAMAKMSDEVRLPIAAAMKPAKLAAILGAMPSSNDARDLTEKLAQRMKRAGDIQQQLNQVTSSGASSSASSSSSAASKTAPASSGKSASSASQASSASSANTPKKSAKDKAKA